MPTTLSIEASENTSTHYAQFGGIVLSLDLFERVTNEEGEITHWEYTDPNTGIRYIIWND